MTSIIPVPQKDIWWATLLEWADYVDDFIVAQGLGSGSALAAHYYDGELSAYRLIDHFGTNVILESLRSNMWTVWSSWLNTLTPAGSTTGFRLFSHGFLRDIQANNAQKTQSLVDLNNLLANASYMNTGSCAPAVSTGDGEAREAAYCLTVFMEAAQAGITLDSTQIARRQVHFEWCIDHHNQWFNSRTAPYVSCFYVGLNARALIKYYNEVAEDSRILPLLKTAADALWAEAWKSTTGPWTYANSFLYRIINTPGPDGGYYDSTVDPFTQPDLNMLICPLYGWLWYMTGDQKWRTRGDAIFQGGIPVYDGSGFHQSGSYLGTRSATNPSGKQYNQQLTWGPEYITWAESEPLTAGEGPTTSADISAEWASRIFGHATIQAISKKAYSYDITQESEYEVSKFYNDAERRINFFTYLVRRNEERLMSGQVRYSYEVMISYYREEDTEGENWTTIRDLFETLFDLVRSEMGQNWHGLVDFWQPDPAQATIEKTTLDSRPVWRGQDKYLATLITNI